MSFRAISWWPLLAAACLLPATPALAVTSDTFEYDAPRVGYYTISPLAMTPENPSVADAFIADGNAGTLYATRNGACFVTGINLPQGASMASVQAWYSSGVMSNFIIFLARHDLATGVVENLVLEVVEDDAGGRQSPTFYVEDGKRAIRNATYAYHMIVCLGTQTAFYGARIRYTYRNAGD